MKRSPMQAIYHTGATEPCAIASYLHCAKCLKERPDDVTPAEWSRTQVGPHAKGFQVWCVRHDCNVAVIEIRPHWTLRNHWKKQQGAA
jgi:hypothetical protein